MINSREQGLTFAVFRGKKNIGEDDLGFPITGEVIRIVPVVIGSKKCRDYANHSWRSAGGCWRHFMGHPHWGTARCIWYRYDAGRHRPDAFPPSQRGWPVRNLRKTKPPMPLEVSANTASQGYPVGLLYGKRRIGGAIISAGIYVEDQQ